jgi:hypothetical protein
MPDNDQGQEQEPFDPGAHTVDEVNDHLAGADPDEVARVLAAESEADKPRKGIVEGPHATEAVEPEPPTFEERLGDADPYELVRAKDVAGNEYTTSRVSALIAGSTVLDKPALDGFGLPAPTKTVLDFRAEATTDAGEPSTEPTKE